MGNNSHIDREILIPIGISIFSMIGICIVLTIAFWQNNRLAPAMTATTTPRQSQPRDNRSSNPGLATVTQETEPAIETQEIEDLEATSNPALPLTERPQPSATSPLPAAPRQNTNTPVSSIPPPPTAGNPTESGPPASIPTAGRTSTATITAETPEDESEAFLAGKYDDTDIRIEYEGDWTSELFVDEAYEETISISTSAGNTATFTFAGKQIELGYLGELEGLGTAIITIDGTAYPPVNQANGSTWLSPQLAAGRHSVVIQHQAGDMVCVDYIDVRG